MASPPPSKRRKRQAVLSSDDEEEETRSQLKHPSLLSRESTPRLPTESLVTRSRAKQSSGSSGRPKSKESSLSAQDDGLSRRLNAQTKAGKNRGSIYNFFNSSSLPQAGKDLAKTPRETQVIETDDMIEDGEIDEVEGTASEKLPRNRSNGKLAEDQRSAASRRFLKEEHEVSKRLENQPLACSVQPWAERYGPRDVSELAVHKKKVDDVRAWLSNVLNGRDRKRLLVLKGPSGSAKTSTIAMLSKALGFNIVEWHNPIGQELDSQNYTSLSSQFQDFLERSGNSAGLEFVDGESFEQNESLARSADPAIDERVILLEELPHTMLQSRTGLASFRMALQCFLATNVPSHGLRHDQTAKVIPLVMLITETARNNDTSTSDNITAHRVLGPDLLYHTGTTVIEFNRIAPTYITKALDTIVKKEARDSGRRKTPSATIIKRLGSLGDIRNAISLLEFLCLRGDVDGNWSGRVASKPRSQNSNLTSMEKEVLESVGQRSDTLDLFHSVGKVVYNKRRLPDDFEPPIVPPLSMPPHLEHLARPLVSEVNIDQLLDETGADLSTFLACLHENYVLSCGGSDFVDTFNDCCDNLSDSDLLHAYTDRPAFGVPSKATFAGSSTDSVRQVDMVFHLAVRGLLFSLPSPVKRSTTVPTINGKRDSYKLFYPASMRLWRQAEEVEEMICHWIEQSRKQQLGGLDSSETHANVRSRPYADQLTMLLEVLPYMVKIGKDRALPSPLVQQLEKVVTFACYHDLHNDHDEEGRLLAIKASSNIATPSRASAQRTPLDDASVPWYQDADKLVLSDDDIDDD